MKIINALQIPESEDVRKTHNASAYPLHANEHVMATMIALQPGESMRRHATPVDVFFYILEGTGVVEIGDERQTVVADMLVDSPARIPHRLLNESDAPFRFLVVKTPRPTEKSRLL
ncbi:MAG: cupin domain-containing protein [Anaerolineaceae bacterium]|nr:cupin domain-containing protein [Anaerolineaceae bacterium]